MPLQASRFAPKTPAETAAQSRTQRLKEDKEKAERLLGRLYWKAESLVASYTRAKEIWFSDPVQNGGMHHQGLSQYPFVQGMTAVRTFQPSNRFKEANFKKKQAESMFKVDFFEWYTLLERFITLCLSVLGISVSGMGPRTNVNALKFITNPDLASRRPEASHQFHANLLEALDDPKNPLHHALGIQDVRIQLGLAKDYRNRWKDADEQVGKRQWEYGDDEEKKPVKLDELDLQQMLVMILHGCQQALNIVYNPPADTASRTPSFRENYDAQTNNGYHGGTMGLEDTPLEYMEDAMDTDW